MKEYELELHHAALDGNIKRVAELLLLKDLDINYQNTDGETALFLAVLYDKQDIVSLLIKHGANTLYKNIYGDTSLIISALLGYLELVLLLLSSKSIDLDYQNHYGNTALMCATKHRRTDIVHLLLENGASINKQNQDKQTTYTIASIFSYEHLTRLFKNIQNLTSLTNPQLEQLFQDNPYFWTKVSKYHSKRAHQYFITQYSILLNQSKDVIFSIFFS